MVKQRSWLALLVRLCAHRAEKHKGMMSSVNSATKKVLSEPSPLATQSEILKPSQRVFDLKSKCLYCCETIDGSYYLKECRKNFKRNAMFTTV